MKNYGEKVSESEKMFLNFKKFMNLKTVPKYKKYNFEKKIEKYLRLSEIDREFHNIYKFENVDGFFKKSLKS